MKLFGMTFGKEMPQATTESYQTFSTPFLKVGNGDLSLPHVDVAQNAENYVYFGSDNLYPQILVQMYYTSPLHSSIINFKTNAVTGGGFELQPDATNTLEDNVYLNAQLIVGNLKKAVPTITQEYITHNRVYIKLHFNASGNVYKYELISADKVRTNRDKSLYYINSDWSRGQYATEKILPYNRKNVGKEKCLLYCFEDATLGQDIYPLPSYSSALNWCFLDGEMSGLLKEYIVNGIFPSYAITFPNKPQTVEEKEELKKTIHGGRGKGGAGKIWTFFGRGKESVPDIQTIPVSNLDNAFQATTESIDSKICQSHTIDPILMGIRVSGKLGSGSDIKQAYTIFEKNVVMPIREKVEYIINDLLKINKAKGTFVFNEYQIVNETIVQVQDESSKTVDALNSMSPLLATKVLESMTENEIRALAGLGKLKAGEVSKGSTGNTPTV